MLFLFVSFALASSEVNTEALNVKEHQSTSENCSAVFMRGPEQGTEEESNHKKGIGMLACRFKETVYRWQAVLVVDWTKQNKK